MYGTKDMSLLVTCYRRYKQYIIRQYHLHVQARMVSIQNKVMKMISKVLIHDTVFPILYQTKDRTKMLNAATAKAAVNAICNSPIASESINGTHPMNYDMARAARAVV